MKPLKMDMSKFKKVSGDKNSATFQHQDGHQIKIALKALSPEMANAFKNLPSQTIDAADAGEENAQKMADGGETLGTKIGYPGSPPPKPMSNGGTAQQNYEAVQRGANTVVYKPAPSSTSGGPVDVPSAEASGTAKTYSDAVKSGKTVPDENPAPKAEDMPLGYAKGGNVCPMCKGGVPHYADGTPDGGVPPPQQPDDLSDIIPPTASDAAPAASTNVPYAVGQKIASTVQGTIGDMKDLISPVAQGVASLYHGMVGDNPDGSDSNPAPAKDVAAVAISNGDQPTAQTAQQISQQQRFAGDPMGMDAYEKTLQKGFSDQAQGIQNEASAAGKQGLAESVALDQNTINQQNALKDYNTSKQQLFGEYDNFIKDVQNQHIDPNHYWASKSTGAKVATGLGLILGGIGGGLTHQGNPALEFLQNNINRDIEAQKANLGKSENLLSANLKQFGNLRDATDMTRVMQQGIVLNQLKSLEAQSTDPVAKARAQQNIGVIEQHQASELGALHQRMYMMKLMSAGDQPGATPGDNTQKIAALRMLGNEPMAKDLEDRSVPGVGTAKVPVPTEARNKLVAGQDFDNKMSDLIDFANTHGTASKLTDPGLVKEMQTKAMNAQSAYREATGMGVLKMGEMPMLDKELPGDPAELFNSVRVVPRYQAVRDSARNTLNTMKQQYGLPAASKQSASSPSAIKIVNGVKYMRGPNGEAIKVQ